LVWLAPLLLAGCETPDPKAELEVDQVETYWVIDSAQGQVNYIAPAVRFSVRNKSAKPRGSVQSTATFRRKGETATWGADWRQVAPAGQPLPPGGSTRVLLRSDARYYSSGAPGSMFDHKLFKDANVEVFLRVGSSGWVKFVESEVERRVGAPDVPPEAK
jgi:hypothetical protein